ncbi:MAG: ABC transporter substrate-binding protein [Candidatus Rokuibacteriota bacterium]
MEGLWQRAVTKLSLVAAVCILAAPLAGEAQPTRKVYRIGYLSTQSSSAVAGELDAFRQGLRDLGYADGQNVVIEYRFAEGKLDRLAGLAAELVRLNVDVIVTGGTPGTRAALQATRTVPLIITVVGDPIAAGFVTSLARPGGNVTGLTQMSPQLSGKRLELLKEALPNISRVAVLIDAALMAHQIFAPLQETQVAAKTLGLRLQSLEVRGPDADWSGAFKAATSQGADALITLPGPVIELHSEHVVDMAAKNRLPAIYPTREFVEAGGLMSYGPDRVDLNRRAATYVDRLLKGAKPAELPIEQPTKFELVINLQTAKALGLTIPRSLLLRADRIVD